MSHAAMISVGILIVLIVVLALLRGKSVATKPLRGAHVAFIVAVAVLLAAGIDYLVVMRPVKAGGGCRRPGSGRDGSRHGTRCRDDGAPRRWHGRWHGRTARTESQA